MYSPVDLSHYFPSYLVNHHSAHAAPIQTKFTTTTICDLIYYFFFRIVAGHCVSNISGGHLKGQMNRMSDMQWSSRGV